MTDEVKVERPDLELLSYDPRKVSHIMIYREVKKTAAYSLDLEAQLAEAQERVAELEERLLITAAKGARTEAALRRMVSEYAPGTTAPHSPVVNAARAALQLDPPQEDADAQKGGS
ncbi:MAG: hypothetical protein WBF53_11520 [Litorimonas sp.]